MNSAPAVKLLVASNEFFSTNPKKLAVESDEITNRTYFIKGDKIVAVATREGENR